MFIYLKSLKRLEGVREFWLIMFFFGWWNDYDLIWIYFKIWLIFYFECFKYKIDFFSIRFEFIIDKNLDIYYVWSIEKFSDRL